MKKFRRRSARMNLMHFRVLTARYFKQIFTSPASFLPLILQAPVLLLIVFLVCRNDAFVQKSAASLTDANVTVFVLVVMSALMGILNSYREICKERDVLSREVFGGLDVSAYVLSKFTVLAVCGIGQCCVLYSGTLLFLDFAYPVPATGYVLSLAAMILTDLSVTAVGLYISALLKKSESAILPVLLIIIMQVVFCDSLFALSGAASWMRYLTPAAWGIAVFSNACNINGWAPEIYQKEMFGYSPLIGLGVLLLFTALFVLFTILRLKRAYRNQE